MEQSPRALVAAVNPDYPLYIVSKGRWETQHTSKALHEMGVPHYIVVEEQEAAAYRDAVGPLATVLVLDPAYQAEYDTCDDLGDTKSKGPGAARNFVWDQAVAAGAEWHWVMDDNIREFFRLNRNSFGKVVDGAFFRAMESFCERYENVAMAGPDYFMFANRRDKVPPYLTNTRIYSCNLIRNDTPYRWRGRYNEDTDLSIRMLRDHWCTIQFYAFLQHKLTTQSVRGGNTKEFYDREGTLAKSRMQVALHPDVSRLVMRWGRPHHYVDYSGFTHRLRRKPGLVVPEEPDEFGMRLEYK
jgi:hypothetical protein